MAKFEVPITWGGIRLWAQMGDVDASRSLVPHELAQGDDHPLHDPGLGAKPIRMTLLFDEFPGEELSGEDRLKRILEQHRGGKAHMLAHPIEGNFLAKIGPFQYRQDEDSNYTADVTFYPDDDDVAVSPAGAGVPAIAGETIVSTAADDLDELLADLEPSDLSDDGAAITDASRDAVESWSVSEEVPTRQIMADVAAITNSIASLINDHGLEDDFALFDVWLGAIMLGEAVRAAATAATAEVAHVFTVRLQEPTVLLALCAQIYGGRLAETRERQVRELNDLRSTAWVGPGELVMPIRDA